MADTVVLLISQGVKMPSALLIHGVPVECINQAAVTYYVPPQVIISVLNVEGGKVGMAKPNTNVYITADSNLRINKLPQVTGQSNSQSLPNPTIFLG